MVKLKLKDTEKDVRYVDNNRCFCDFCGETKPCFVGNVPSHGWKRTSSAYVIKGDWKHRAFFPGYIIDNWGHADVAEYVKDTGIRGAICSSCAKQISKFKIPKS